MGSGQKLKRTKENKVVKLISSGPESIDYIQLMGLEFLIDMLNVCTRPTGGN